MLLAVMSGSSYPTPELLLFPSALFEIQIRENLFSQAEKCVCVWLVVVPGFFGFRLVVLFFFFLEELKM